MLYANSVHKHPVPVVADILINIHVIRHALFLRSQLVCCLPVVSKHINKTDFTANHRFQNQVKSRNLYGKKVFWGCCASTSEQ